MRNTWIASIVVLVGGCAGGLGTSPWDQNHDGLVGACEGLNRWACGATSGCEGEELACAAVCRDDGKGGCLPCPEDFRCVPTGCEKLAVGLCGLASACSVQTKTVCSGVAHSEGAPEAGCGGGCTTVQVCATRPVQSCESTSVASCTANPACRLEQGPVCEIACLGTECPLCATASQRCVTRPVDDACASLSDAACTASAGCRLEGAVCSLVCEDDGKGGCLPCPNAPTRCVASTLPASLPASGR